MAARMDKWLERKFADTPAPGSFPMIVERLRGTPGRVEEKLAGVDHAKLTHRDGDAWSLLEHAGHLIDLEELWMGRFDDFEERKEALRAADMTNRKTYEANHNATDPAKLLATLRETRAMLVKRLDAYSDADVVATAHHPRLNRPMRAIDLAHFIAEHDDHHLAIMQRILAR